MVLCSFKFLLLSVEVMIVRCFFHKRQFQYHYIETDIKNTVISMEATTKVEGRAKLIRRVVCVGRRRRCRRWGRRGCWCRRSCGSSRRCWTRARARSPAPRSSRPPTCTASGTWSSCRSAALPYTSCVYRTAICHCYYPSSPPMPAMKTRIIVGGKRVRR